MWTTKTIGTPVVQFRAASSLGAFAFAVPSTTTYTAADMCPGGPADSSGFIAPGMIHRAVMTGLRPATAYTYRVGDAGTQVFSENFTFTSAGADTKGAVRVLVLADMGTNEAAFDGATNGGHPVGDNVMTVPMAHALWGEVAGVIPPPPSPSSPWWAGRPSLVVHHGIVCRVFAFVPCVFMCPSCPWRR